MRQPLCGWLLAIAVANATASAEASTPEPASHLPSGAPCVATGTLRPADDSTCCHGPDFKPVPTVSHPRPADRPTATAQTKAQVREALAK